MGTVAAQRCDAPAQYRSEPAYDPFRQVAQENRLKRDAGDFNWQGLAFSLDPATYAK
jgi:hypothetical protein